MFCFVCTGLRFFYCCFLFVLLLLVVDCLGILLFCFCLFVVCVLLFFPVFFFLFLSLQGWRSFLIRSTL